VRIGLGLILAACFFSVGPLYAQSSPVSQPAEEKTQADNTDSGTGKTDSGTGKTDSGTGKTDSGTGKTDSGTGKTDSGAGASGSGATASKTDTDLALGYQTWGRANYLLWSVRSAPVRVPIVTTGNPNVGFDPNMLDTVNTAGAIGQPGTQVLLGGNSQSFSPASGMRLTLGAWIDDHQRLGLEGNAFVLQSLTSRFAAASNDNGSPPLYFPIFSGIADAERAIPIADPLRGFSGNVAVTSTLELWGAEANVLCTIYRTPALDFSLLAGFRYLDLSENLNIHNTTRDLLFGNVTIINDSFHTSNQFYGGQFGARLSAQLDRLSLEITGKLAVGSAHQVVDIEGNITQLGANVLVPPGPGTFPGGLYAQSTNIGPHNANPVSVPFMALPSLEFHLAYRLTERISAFAGYDILSLTQVVRPGNQINHNVNLSQSAVLDPNGVGTLVGPAQPAPVVNRSDFWAQGISIGLEFQY
jgi:Putative beta barrel porin-7 (BBP7)